MIVRNFVKDVNRKQFGTFARLLLKDYFFAHALMCCLQSKDNQLIRGCPDFWGSLF
jgi:hypothetical protein